MSDVIIKRLHIRSITPSLKTGINTFNDKHNGTIFNEVEFNEITASILKTELTYFIAEKNNVLVGICPCHSYNTGLMKRSYSNLSSHEIPYGGWIYNSEQISLEKLIQHMPLRVNEGFWITSHIETDDHTPYSCCHLMSNTGTTLLQELDNVNTETLFAQMNSKQRNKIKRALNLGVEIKEITPSDFSVFWDLICRLKAKTKMPIRNRDFYERIFIHYNQHSRAKCLAAYYNGQPISAMILLHNSNFANAWIAGRIEELPNNLYQNELLFWESIKWAEEVGSKFFDFCGLDVDKLPHLARMKLSFSHDIRSIYYYSKRSLLYRLLNRLSSLC